MKRIILMIDPPLKEKKYEHKYTSFLFYDIFSFIGLIIVRYIKLLCLQFLQISILLVFHTCLFCVRRSMPIRVCLFE